MTTDQLNKANELVEKIKKSKTYLGKIKEITESNKDSNPNFFKIQFDGTTLNFEFTTGWIQDVKIKEDVVNILKNTHLQLVQAFEADLAAMELELSNL